MRNKFLYAIISCILLNTNAQAQIEDIIKSYVDSTEFLVNNGRKLILKSVLENDQKKTKEIFQYLESKTENNEVSAFNYYESIYITMLNHDWGKWMDYTNNYNKYYKAKTYQNSYQILDQLYDEIIKKNELILFSIESSNMDDEGKSVAKLLLHFLINQYRTEEYNKMLGDFNKTYESSKFNAFLINSLPHKVAKGSWAFSLGANTLFLTENLKENFTPSIITTISMDINIGKVFSSLYLTFGFLKLNNEYSATSGAYTWNFRKDEYFDYFEGGALIGYFLIRNKRFHVSPYLKIAGSNLESDWYETTDEGEELDLLNSFTYGPGLHTEFKLFDFKPKSSLFRNYISIKVEGGYNIIHRHKYDDLSGNSGYIGAALVWGMGQF